MIGVKVAVAVAAVMWADLETVATVASSEGRHQPHGGKKEMDRPATTPGSANRRFARAARWPKIEFTRLRCEETPFTV